MAIYSKFHNLPVEKQTKIMHAAIKEFVENGFENASTNAMVKHAHISKGSLFNYFHSKKDLYIYLIEHSVKVIESFYEQIDLHETDLFKRIENIGLQKLRVHQKFPYAFDFLASAVQEEAIEVKEVIQQKVQTIYEEGRAKIYENIDFSNFREEIEIEKAIEIMNWTMFGFGEKGMKQISSFEKSGDFAAEYMEEWRKYAEILRYSFYK